MKKKIVNRMLAAMLCASMVGSLAPTTMMSVSAAQINKSGLTTLAEEDIVVETTLGFEQAYAKVGEPLKAVVSNAPEGASYTYSWNIDGKLQSTITGDTYTPSASDLEKFIEVTARDTSGKAYKASMYFSKLPVVYVNTDNGEPIKDKDTYLPGNMSVQGNDKFKDSSQLYTGLTEIKGRGNSTWGMPKKPYKLKLDKKADLFGYGKNKHWVLLANYLDPSLSRNKLSYDFSGVMGMPSMQSENVALVLNGRYQGTYQLCEHIRIDEKGNRISITDWENLAEDVVKAIAKVDTSVVKGDLEDAMKEDLSWVTSGSFNFKDNGITYKISDYYTKKLPSIEGGYILELDSYFDEVSKFTSSMGQPIMFNAPEFTATNKEMFTYIVEYINAFETAIQSADGYTTYKGQEKHYTELFDMEALVEFWLVNELFFNEDAMKKSTYMYKNNGELMKMGPIWDMDWAAGGLQGNSKPTNQWQTLFFNANAQRSQWYKQIVKDPYFAFRAYQTYHQYRDYIGSMVANQGLMDTGRQYLEEAGLANDKVWFNGQGYVGETLRLKTWLAAKISWLDQQFSSVDTLLQSLRTYNSNQQGTSKLGIDSIEDTADGGITVTTTLNSGSASDVKVYVNGILAGTGTKNEQNKATITIAGDKLEAGAQNMIVIRAFSSWATYTDYEIHVAGGNSTIVNKNALNAAIALAKGKNAADYTADSYAVLKEKLTAAEVVNDNVDATQAQVNTALNELNAAISGLILANPVAPSDPIELPTKGMTATAGSEEPLSDKNKDQGPARFLLDGNQDTLWHTAWAGVSRDKHYVDINLGGSYDISGVKITPRQDKSYNGVMLSCQVLTSTDGVNFTKVADADFKEGPLEETRTVRFQETKANYVRVKSMDSLSSDGKEYSSAAEMRIIGVEKSTVSANKTNLKAAIDQAEAVVEAQYTAESYKALIDAKVAAKGIYSDSSATQQQVDDATSALNTAITNLVKNTATKDKLMELITTASAIKGDTYTPSSFGQLTEAIGLANGVYNEPTATPSAVEEAIDGLTQAMNNLKKKAIKTVLQSKVAEAKEYDKNKYTDLTYRQIEIALDSAQQVLDNENAIQSDVEARIIDLKVAIEGLKLKANNTKLVALIEEAKQLKEEDYTIAAWENFRAILGEAEIVAANVDATQAEVDAAFKALQDVMPVKPPVIIKGWNKDEKGYYFVKENGTKAKDEWLKIEKSWYYFKGVYKQTDWTKVGATWYYLDKDGKMLTGWQKLGGVWYYLGDASSGKMVTGWQQIKGTWYYFAPSGKMLTGWQKLGGVWYYLSDANSGKMVKGWQKIKGTWYYFASSGKMTTGWQKVANEWYYMASSGKMMTGWIKVGGKSYYLKSNGVMAKNTWIGKYYVNGSGVWTKTR